MVTKPVSFNILNELDVRRLEFAKALPNFSGVVKDYIDSLMSGRSAPVPERIRTESYSELDPEFDPLDLLT